MKTSLSLTILTICLGITGCGKNDPFANLSDAERKLSQQQAKEGVVKRLLCNRLNGDSYDYRQAKEKRQFQRHNEYFPEYRKHFERMKSAVFYPLYRSMVSDILQAQGVNMDSEFKDMVPPEIGDLNCNEVVQEWLFLREEWTRLRDILPDNFFVK